MEVLTKVIRQEKKSIQSGKKEAKRFSLTDKKILYINSLIFLHISSEQSKNEIKKNLFRNHIKKDKHLVVNSMGEIQGLYTENHKTMGDK